MRPRFVALLEPWLGSFAHLVPGYAFMLVLGAVLGAFLAVDRARRAGFERRDAVTVLMIAYASGLAGALAVPGGQAVLAWLAGGRLAAPTGMAAYGGLVGGTVGGVLYLRKKQLNAWVFLDACAPSLALGIFCARIGCFLAGCDYGAPTTSVIGTSFPMWSHAFNDHVARGLIDIDAPGSLPVHPTELYEAGAGFALFYVVRAISSRTASGASFVALVLGYGALRSIIELFRGDASRGHLGALSTAQLFAIVTSIVVLFLFVRARARTRRLEIA